MTDNNFEIIAGSADSSVIIHVPHAGTKIPDWVRAQFLLSPEDMAGEIYLMTDVHTDMLAKAVYEAAARKPTLFINKVSRFVIDPERFPDEREEMNAVGMGVVYTKTSDQRQLREPNPAVEAQLVAEYFEPYSIALAELTAQVLAKHGRVTIIDLHSFGSIPLKYELHAEGQRPAVCLGADAFHTGAPLLAAATAAFSQVGSTAVNKPFEGTYVPLDYYDREPRVQSIMFEIRKDTYGFGDPATSEFQATVAAITEVIGAIS